MKRMESLIQTMKSPLLIKTTFILLACISSFLLGKHWSSNSHQLIFFFPIARPSQAGGRNHHIAISPNANLSFDIPSLISNASPPPPPPPPEKFGVVNENGEMTDGFDAAAFDPDLGESNGTRGEREEEGSARVFRVGKFRSCAAEMSEYIPCLDNWEGLDSSGRGERFERHCPEKGKGLDCLVPAPKNYRTRIDWPKSRDEVC